MTETSGNVPNLQLGGAEMPRLGFGTWRLSGAACRDAVATAVDVGFRHIDTAAMYQNEADVGAALAASSLPRADLFVTTKIWRDDLQRDALLHSVGGSLRRLKLDAEDLLLIHWPNADIPLAETMAALCEARRQGLTRHIGVSNFPVALLDEAARLADAPILANQCEYHPELDQSPLIAACRNRGTAFVSYRPLGQGRLLDHPVIRAIADAHGKTPGQVILRWHMQQPGVVAIPRSATPAHIAENIAVFDFILTEGEMNGIFALATPDGRHVNPAWAPRWDKSGVDTRLP